ncbi:MAG TPA: cupin domain-containing protein [Pseudomonadales bacterium]
MTNINEASFEEVRTARGKTLRQLDLSGSHLGGRIEDLPPGGTSSIHHYHTLEEEHVLVLSGSATLHLGTEEHELREGDHVCFLAGEPAPHHIENRSSGNFKFLVFGERNPGDTVFYPNGSVMMVKAAGGALYRYEDYKPDQ